MGEMKARFLGEPMIFICIQLIDSFLALIYFQKPSRSAVDKVEKRVILGFGCIGKPKPWFRFV